jgi:hypothetical protein
MASTVTAATFTSTITESITLAGSDRGSTHTFTVSSVNEVYNQIVTVDTSEVDILGFGSATGQGIFLNTDLRYIRITNKDDTNFVTIGVSDTGSDTFFVKLEAGQSYLMCNDDLEVHATGGASSTFSQMDNISAKSDTAACDLEVLVASV